MYILEGLMQSVEQEFIHVSVNGETLTLGNFVKPDYPMLCLSLFLSVCTRLPGPPRLIGWQIQ